MMMAAVSDTMVSVDGEVVDDDAVTATVPGAVMSAATSSAEVVGVGIVSWAVSVVAWAVSVSINKVTVIREENRHSEFR